MQLSKASSALRARPQVSRRGVVVRAAANRPMWYPGAAAPSHLNGTLAGDYGFDPLRLGTNPDNLKWFVEGELTNGRWAMAAVAGILFTDLVGLPKFWLAGAETYALDTKTLAIIEVVVFAFVEAKRYESFKKVGEGGALGIAPFDPMGMKSAETQLKEVKNARLAMLAFLGFCSQAAVRGLGPIDCLKLHLEDPWNNNIFTSSVGPESTIAVAVLAVWPMIIEATKTLNKGKPESVPTFPWL
ncbi:MAG: light-harvesting protein of photosystem I [Monoraphidium minutum]|nr:MAG: light-harvesting protein of photosystem I [Monoraphidium minutum]